MKPISVSTIIIILGLAALCQSASQCYQCNSNYDSACDDPFESSGPGNGNNGDSSVPQCTTHSGCQKKTYSNGTIVRACVNGDKGCTTDDEGTETCYCNAQLCNGSPAGLYWSYVYVFSLAVPLMRFIAFRL